MKFLFLLLFIQSTALADNLSVESFLQQVRTKNQNIISSYERSVAAYAKSSEADHLTAPALIADVYQYSDKRQTNNPAFQGNETKIRSYSFGFSELTPFGMTAKLTYLMQKTELVGVNPLFVPTKEFFDTRPTLELSQALWSNGFGASTRAAQDLIEASNLATSYSESFRIKQELMNAELTYWRLSLARQMLGMQKDNLARADKIRAWSEKRARFQLADRSDFLQAEAAYKIRQLDLQSTTDEEKAAARAFNAARGLLADEVNETLTVISPDLIKKIKSPDRLPKREDIQMSEQLAKATQANAKVQNHKIYPAVDLYGSYAFNGRDADLRESMKESFKPDHPLWTVGVKLNAPLDFFTQYDLHDAYSRDSVSAEVTLDRKLLEQEQEWKDVSTKFDQAKHRLELAYAIENAQKEKLMHERKRLERGRTTTYQVVMFEQDYTSAQVIRIQNESLVLQLFAQLKLFSASEKL